MYIPRPLMDIWLSSTWETDVDTHSGLNFLFTENTAKMYIHYVLSAVFSYFLSSWKNMTTSQQNGKLNIEWKNFICRPFYAIRLKWTLVYIDDLICYCIIFNSLILITYLQDAKGTVNVPNVKDFGSPMEHSLITNSITSTLLDRLYN